MRDEYTAFLERKRSEYGEEFKPPHNAETFAPFLHKPVRVRVRTTYESGEVYERTGTVGVTTGWRPCFLLLHRANAHGSWDTIGRDSDEIIAVQVGRKYIEVTPGDRYSARRLLDEAELRHFGAVSRAFS